MTIILWIIGGLFALGLIVILFQLAIGIIAIILSLLLRLVKPALIIAAFWLVYSLFGKGGIVAGLLIGAFIYMYRNAKRNQDEQLVKKVFYEYEMTTIQDLQSQLNGAIPFAKLQEIINKFTAQGKLEKIDFNNGEELFRWTEKRKYPHGVITNHITVD